VQEEDVALNIKALVAALTDAAVQLALYRED
jgi:hypothetical protein